MSSIREKLADAVWPQGAERRNTLERLVNTDSLTGLANGRALEMALPEAEADKNTQIVVIDIDNFKKLNDTAGHKDGDTCLIMWAKWIQSLCLGTSCRPFRKSGDEFVVLATAELAQLFVSSMEMVRFFHTSGIVVSASAASADTFVSADARMLQKKAQKGVLR